MRGENGEFLAGGGGVHTRNGYYAEQMAGFGGIGGLTKLQSLFMLSNNFQTHVGIGKTVDAI